MTWLWTWLGSPWVVVVAAILWALSAGLVIVFIIGATRWIPEQK